MSCLRDACLRVAQRMNGEAPGRPGAIGGAAGSVTAGVAGVGVGVAGPVTRGSASTGASAREELVRRRPAHSDGTISSASSSRKRR